MRERENDEDKQNRTARKIRQEERCRREDEGIRGSFEEMRERVCVSVHLFVCFFLSLLVCLVSAG